MYDFCLAVLYIDFVEEHITPVRNIFRLTYFKGRNFRDFANFGLKSRKFDPAKIFKTSHLRKFVPAKRPEEVIRESLFLQKKL